MKIKIITGCICVLALTGTAFAKEQISLAAISKNIETNQTTTKTYETKNDKNISFDNFYIAPSLEYVIIDDICNDNSISCDDKNIGIGVELEYRVNREFNIESKLSYIDGFESVNTIQINATTTTTSIDEDVKIISFGGEWKPDYVFHPLNMRFIAKTGIYHRFFNIEDNTAPYIGAGFYFNLKEYRITTEYAKYFDDDYDIDAAIISWVVKV